MPIGGGGSEERVALEAVRCAEGATAGRRAHVGYFLVGDGRRVLEERLGSRAARVERGRRWLRAHATPVYLGGIGLVLALQEVLLARALGAWEASGAAALASMVLALVPMTTAAVAAMNALVTRTLPPTLLPKLELRDGVPDDCRTLVAVPVLLTSADAIDSLVEALEIRFLGNADPNVHFALLAESPGRGRGDGTRRRRAAAPPADRGGNPRAERSPRRARALGPFHLFHRGRTWCETEGCWMGWERKRGKLVELHRWLLGARDASPLLHIGDAASLTGVRYVITLDADTGLPRDTARRLIGTLAHPLNQPVSIRRRDRPAAGYTVLQPRVEIDPASRESTPLASLFASHAGFDPYARAVSDVYQDLFGEGSYVGKGIYEVASFEESHAGRVPDGVLLSHDLFEGMHGRAGLVTDVVLLEQYPEHYLSYARRLHRWARGDWQLVPWLGRRVPVAGGGRAPSCFSALSRWKIVDNLRRALLQPTLLGLLLVAWLWLPGPALLWTAPILLSLLVPLFIDLLSPVVASLRRGLRPVLFGALETPWSALAIWALAIAVLPYEAALLMDAAVRTLVRIAFTRRHLLEWTPAAEEHRALSEVETHALVWREMLGRSALCRSHRGGRERRASRRTAGGAAARAPVGGLTRGRMARRSPICRSGFRAQRPTTSGVSAFWPGGRGASSRPSSVPRINGSPRTTFRKTRRERVEHPGHRRRTWASWKPATIAAQISGTSASSTQRCGYGARSRRSSGSNATAAISSTGTTRAT